MFKWLKKEKTEKTKFGEPILLCPRDKIGMDKIKKNEVIIDICRKCNGIWLDDKEIDKILEFAKSRKPFKKQNNSKAKGE